MVTRVYLLSPITYHLSPTTYHSSLITHHSHHLSLITYHLPPIAIYSSLMNPRPPEIPPHKLISALRGYDLLPAIIFLPTRRKCDEAASEVAGDRSQKTDPERQKKREAIFLEFAAYNPEIRTHKHQKILVNS